MCLLAFDLFIKRVGQRAVANSGVSHCTEHPTNKPVNIPPWGFGPAGFPLSARGFFVVSGNASSRNKAEFFAGPFILSASLDVLKGSGIDELLRRAWIPALYGKLLY
jgi:hypothetical protein